jgi:uncharacterized protein
LRLLVLLIDKVGHRHQAEGLAKVVGRMQSGLTTDRLEIKARPLAHASLRYAALGWNMAPRTALRLFYGIDPARLDRPDMIVSSGRPAIAAGLFLKRYFNIPYIYSGLAEGVAAAAEIERLLVSAPSFGDLPNAVVTPMPTLVEPDKLPAARRLGSQSALVGARLALLIGGNAHSHRYDAGDWSNMLRLIIEARQALGIEWIVATSRRTPVDTVDGINSLVRDGLVAAHHDFHKNGAGNPADLFAADAIVVTEDSVSMMWEAVEAQRPVIALRPRLTKATAVDDIVKTLSATGALASLPLADLDVRRFAGRLISLVPLKSDWRDAVAAVIAPFMPSN